MFYSLVQARQLPFIAAPKSLGLGGLERCFQRNMGISLLEWFLKKRIELFPAGGVGRTGSSTLAHSEGQPCSAEVELMGHTQV